MRRSLRLSAAAALLLLLTGCVTYQPQPLHPEAELAALRGRELDGLVIEHARPGQAGAASAGAFDLTDGLDEAETVAVALTLNPDLRAKRLEAGAAGALLIEAGLWPNPEVGFGWRPGIAGASGYSVDAEVLFELLRLGERSARQDAAKARIREVGAEIVAAEYQLVADVRRQRLAVRVAAQTGKLLGQELQLRTRLQELVRQRRQLGEGTALEVVAADLEVAEAQRDLRQAQATVHRERRELNRLLGLPAGHELRLSDLERPLAVAVFSDLADAELDQRLLAGRYELRAAHAAYEQAEAELRLAVLRQYPRVKLGPAFEKELEGDQGLGIGVSVELPLFDRNQGEIAEKAAQRRQQRARYTALLHTLRAGAHGARAELRRARQEVDAQQRELLPAIERQQQLFEAAFRARELPVLEWVAAQERLARARREHVQALIEYQRALIDFESALGLPLGWPVPAPATQAATAPAQTQPATMGSRP